MSLIVKGDDSVVNDFVCAPQVKTGVVYLAGDEGVTPRAYLSIPPRKQDGSPGRVLLPHYSDDFFGLNRKVDEADFAHFPEEERAAKIAARREQIAKHRKEQKHSRPCRTAAILSPASSAGWRKANYKGSFALAGDCDDNMTVREALAHLDLMFGPGKAPHVYITASCSQRLDAGIDPLDWQNFHIWLFFPTPHLLGTDTLDDRAAALRAALTLFFSPHPLDPDDSAPVKSADDAASDLTRKLAANYAAEAFFERPGDGFTLARLPSPRELASWADDRGDEWAAQGDLERAEKCRSIAKTFAAKMESAGLPNGAQDDDDAGDDDELREALNLKEGKRERRAVAVAAPDFAALQNLEVVQQIHEKLTNLGCFPERFTAWLAGKRPYADADVGKGEGVGRWFGPRLYREIYTALCMLTNHLPDTELKDGRVIAYLIQTMQKAVEAPAITAKYAATHPDNPDAYKAYITDSALLDQLRKAASFRLVPPSNASTPSAEPSDVNGEGFLVALIPKGHGKEQTMQAVPVCPAPRLLGVVGRNSSIFVLECAGVVSLIQPGTDTGAGRADWWAASGLARKLTPNFDAESLRRSRATPAMIQCLNRQMREFKGDMPEFSVVGGDPAFLERYKLSPAAVSDGGFIDERDTVFLTARRVVRSSGGGHVALLDRRRAPMPSEGPEFERARETLWKTAVSAMRAHGVPALLATVAAYCNVLAVRAPRLTHNEPRAGIFVGAARGSGKTTLLELTRALAAMEKVEGATGAAVERLMSRRGLPILFDEVKRLDTLDERVRASKMVKVEELVETLTQTSNAKASGERDIIQTRAVGLSWVTSEHLQGYRLPAGSGAERRAFTFDLQGRSGVHDWGGRRLDRKFHKEVCDLSVRCPGAEEALILIAPRSLASPDDPAPGETPFSDWAGDLDGLQGDGLALFAAHVFACQEEAPRSLDERMRLEFERLVKGFGGAEGMGAQEISVIEGAARIGALLLVTLALCVEAQTLPPELLASGGAAICRFLQTHMVESAVTGVAFDADEYFGNAPVISTAPSRLTSDELDRLGDSGGAAANLLKLRQALTNRYRNVKGRTVNLDATSPLSGPDSPERLLRSENAANVMATFAFALNVWAKQVPLSFILGKRNPLVPMNALCSVFAYAAGKGELILPSVEEVEIMTSGRGFDPNVAARLREVAGDPLGTASLLLPAANWAGATDDARFRAAAVLCCGPTRAMTTYFSAPAKEEINFAGDLNPGACATGEPPMGPLGAIHPHFFGPVDGWEALATARGKGWKDVLSLRLKTFVRTSSPLPALKTDGAQETNVINMTARRVGIDAAVAEALQGARLPN